MSVAQAAKPQVKKPVAPPVAPQTAQVRPAGPAKGGYDAGAAAVKPAPVGDGSRPGGFPEPRNKHKKKKNNNNGQNGAVKPAGPTAPVAVTPAPVAPAPVAQKPLDPLKDPTKNPEPTNEFAPTAAYNGETKGEVAVKGEGDAHEIDPNDVEQGSLGDCYFVAQLASQAKTNPGRIKDLIKDNGNNTFTVTLHLKDKREPWKRVPTDIVVDAQFPQKDGGVAYAKPGDRGTTGPELWVMLIEKAFAKYSGSFEQIRGSKTKDGDVFAMMSGVGSKSFSPASQGADKLLETLTKALAAGQAVSFGAKSKNTADEALQAEAKTEGVVLNHAYSLMAVDAKARTVSLRNPWGVKHLMDFSVDKLVKFYDSVDIAAK